MEYTYVSGYKMFNPATTYRYLKNIINFISTSNLLSLIKNTNDIRAGKVMNSLILYLFKTMITHKKLNSRIIVTY